jgi:6-phosphofructokinase 1
VDCIDRLRDTMQSHERCAVVEVMGRHAGYLALHVGVAVGATAVLVPEYPYNFDEHVAEKIRRARLSGKTNFIIVVAEGAVSAVSVGEQIRAELGLDPRVSILGHIQRGGAPTVKYRVMATRMGYEAVRLLSEGKTNRIICAEGDKIVDRDIAEALQMKKTLNPEEFKVMTVMTGT